MTDSITKIWSSEEPLQNIKKTADTIMTLINKDKKRFSLWLEGELGAGKTTMTGELLYSLGLARGEPVLSPTYTYMNEYHIDGRWFSHMDLYRVKHKTSLEEYGISLQREYEGFFLEWAEKILWTHDISPTHKLTINYCETDTSRQYSLFKFI